MTTGATSDFPKVYAIAREMILTYGMSSAIGKINVQSETLSQKTARDVDIEVKRIVDECYSEVMKILRKYRPQLEELKDILLEDEIIDGSIVYDLVKNVNYVDIMSTTGSTNYSLSGASPTAEGGEVHQHQDQGVSPHGSTTDPQEVWLL